MDFRVIKDRWIRNLDSSEIIDRRMVSMDNYMYHIFLNWHKVVHVRMSQVTPKRKISASPASNLVNSYRFNCGIKQNKFVRTKIRLKLGTEIDFSESFVRFVRLICQICQILFSSDSMSLFSASWPFPIKFRGLTRDRPTDRPRTDGWTDPHIEMRGRI